MRRERIVPQPEVIRAIVLEDSPCCGMPAPERCCSAVRRSPRPPRCCRAQPRGARPERLATLTASDGAPVSSTCRTGDSHWWQQPLPSSRPLASAKTYERTVRLWVGVHPALAHSLAHRCDRVRRRAEVAFVRPEPHLEGAPAHALLLLRGHEGHDGRKPAGPELTNVDMLSLSEGGAICSHNAGKSQDGAPLDDRSVARASDDAAALHRAAASWPCRTEPARPVPRHGRQQHWFAEIPRCAGRSARFTGIGSERPNRHVPPAEQRFAPTVRSRLLWSRGCRGSWVAPSRV